MQQPMLANFRPSHRQERPEEIAYVLRLARLRQQGLNYLLLGEFLRPPAMNAPEAACDMSRLSIYAGQQGGLQTRPHAQPFIGVPYTIINCSLAPSRAGCVGARSACRNTTTGRA